IKRKAHVKQSFSLDFLERGTFTEYPYIADFSRLIRCRLFQSGIRSYSSYVLPHKKTPEFLFELELLFLKV
ncbi:hypothetical protein, partial [Bacteroides xylanisolvens]|uniref:hypothetical protein n=1 Tax=Bacteroides xylanisolvens TaxID=371601 RepID=UPI001E5F0A5A